MPHRKNGAAVFEFAYCYTVNSTTEAPEIYAGQAGLRKQSKYTFPKTYGYCCHWVQKDSWELGTKPYRSLYSSVKHDVAGDGWCANTVWYPQGQRQQRISRTGHLRAAIQFRVMVRGRCTAVGSTSFAMNSMYNFKRLSVAKRSLRNVHHIDGLILCC